MILQMAVPADGFMAKWHGEDAKTSFRSILKLAKWHVPCSF